MELPSGTTFTPLFSHQRAWDLLRYARHLLHTENMLTNEEYALLAQDHEAVTRLEDYDARHDKIKRLYPCRYPQIHKDGQPNGCPDCT